MYEKNCDKDRKRQQNMRNKKKKQIKRSYRKIITIIIYLLIESFSHQ